MTTPEDDPRWKLRRFLHHRYMRWQAAAPPGVRRDTLEHLREASAVSAGALSGGVGIVKDPDSRLEGGEPLPRWATIEAIVRATVQDGEDAAVLIAEARGLARSAGSQGADNDFHAEHQAQLDSLHDDIRARETRAAQAEQRAQRAESASRSLETDLDAYRAASLKELTVERDRHRRVEDQSTRRIDELYQRRTEAVETAERLRVELHEAKTITEALESKLATQTTRAEAFQQRGAAYQQALFLLFTGLVVRSPGASAASDESEFDKQRRRTRAQVHAEQARAMRSQRRWSLAAAAVVLILVAAAVSAFPAEQPAPGPPSAVDVPPVPPPARPARVDECYPGVLRVGPECAGWSDGRYAFGPPETIYRPARTLASPELEIKDVLDRVYEANNDAFASGRATVSIAYFVPLTRGPSPLLNALRRELEGAVLAQRWANARNAAGPAIRLLIFNVGQDSTLWRQVMPEVIAQRDGPNRLVAVAGLGQSLQSTREQINELAKIGMPMFPSRLTADDLSVIPGNDVAGLFRVAPTNRDQATVAAAALKRRTADALIVQDRNPNDAYTTGLAEAFRAAFIQVPGGRLAPNQLYSSTAWNTNPQPRAATREDFRELVTGVCTTPDQVNVLYYAGRGVDLPAFLQALGDRAGSCADRRFTVATGDDGTDMVEQLRLEIRDGGDALQEALRSKITVLYTALAHPQTWTRTGQTPPELADRIAGDCPTCGRTLFPRDQIDQGDQQMGFDAVMTAAVCAQASTAADPLPTTPTVLGRAYRINATSPLAATSGALAFDERGRALGKIVPLVQIDSNGELTVRDIDPAPPR